MARTISYTTTVSCPCCSGRTAAALQCRQRGGSAFLCGYPEYTSISTPPKRYRTRTMTGSAVGILYNNTSCATETCRATDTVSGSCFYNQTTCSFTIGGSFSRSSSPGGCSTSPTVPQCDWGAVFTGGGDSEVLTQTTRTFANDGLCKNIGGGAGFKRGSDSRREEISDEDLETDAVTRLLASTTYSAWANCLTYNVCCKADYEQRTTSITFSYHEAQWRVTGVITPSTFAYCNAYAYRRPWGTVTWTLYSIMVQSGTSTVTGLFVSTPDDVPNTEGYETYVGDPFIV